MGSISREAKREEKDGGKGLTAVTRGMGWRGRAALGYARMGEDEADADQGIIHDSLYISRDKECYRFMSSFVQIL